MLTLGPLPRRVRSAIDRLPIETEVPLESPVLALLQHVRDTICFKRADKALEPAIRRLFNGADALVGLKAGELVDDVFLQGPYR